MGTAIKQLNFGLSLHLDRKFGLSLSLSEITLLFDWSLDLDRTLAQRRHSSSRNHILMSFYEAETLSSVDFSTATFYILFLCFSSSLFNLEVDLLFRRFLIDWLIDWLIERLSQKLKSPSESTLTVLYLSYVRSCRTAGCRSATDEWHNNTITLCINHHSHYCI